MRRVNILLLALILCNGCVSETYNYKFGPAYNYHAQIRIISEPPLDKVVTAYVGDNMVKQIQKFEYDAIYLKNNVFIDGIYGTYKFTPGYYVKKAENEKFEFYYQIKWPLAGKMQYEDSEGGIGSGYIDILLMICIDKNTGNFYLISTDNKVTRIREADYERKKYPVTSPDFFERTLIYKGRVGDKINIEYCEFFQDIERPSFNHEELEYDLSETNIIVYKTARIEVIAVTNDYIIYKVIQNFKNVKN